MRIQLFFAVILLPAPALAETIFAGIQGCSDTGAGTQAQPYCSLAKAAARLKPGDTLSLLGGTYTQQLVIPASASGTDDKHVLIQSAPGPAAVLDGKTLAGLTDQGLIQGAELKNIEIRNITLKGSQFYCLRLSRVTGIVIEGVNVDGCRHGGLVIDGPSQNVKIQKCDVKGTDLCGTGCGIHEAITISNVVGFVVSGNTVHDGIKEGIDAKDGSGEGEIVDNQIFKMGQVGLYLNHAYRVKVYRNRIHDVGSSGIQLAVGDFATSMPETTDNEVFQNDIWNNGLSGVQFWRTFVGDVRNNRIYNNTLVGNKFAGIYIEEARDNQLQNNILVGNKAHGIFGDTAGFNTVNRNLFFTNGGEPQEAEWENPIHADPLFVDAAAADFHLRQGSPAIDQGMYVGLTSVGQPDIGAHEFGEGTTPGGGGGGCVLFATRPMLGPALWAFACAAVAAVALRVVRRHRPARRHRPNA